MAGDEGFEPPQTESESGVLPLHKSPVRNANIIILKTDRMSRLFSANLKKIIINVFERDS